jgi:hypothetical protein
LVAPDTLPPFSFHWYVGADPPFKTSELKTTELPAQEGLAEGVIVTLTAP